MRGWRPLVPLPTYVARRFGATSRNIGDTVSVTLDVRRSVRLCGCAVGMVVRQVKERAMGARRKRLLVGQCACALLALVAAFLVTAPRDAQAVADAAPGASCARLAAVDRSATSGPAWGTTIFPGHGAPGGWFGVDVCANGFNA